MRFVLPLVAAILPVAIAPGFLFYFDVTPKLVILLIGTAVALVLWRGELALGSKANRIFHVLLLAQAVSLVVSTVLSTNPALSLNGGNWRRYGLVSQLAVLLFTMLVAADCASDAGRVRTYLKAIVLGGIPVAIYTVMQYFGWDPWLDKSAYHVGEIVRPPSTLGHADYLGTYLVVVVFAAASSIGLQTCVAPLPVPSVHRSGDPRFAGPCRMCYRLVGFLACIAIVLSGSRAALLGLVAGAVVLLSVKRQYKRWAIGAAVAIALGCVFVFSPAGKAIRNRVSWIATEPLGGARPFLWRDSLAMSTHHLALGYGPETFIAEFPRQESIALARAFPDFLHESPHNIFLDALVSQGVAGALILGGLCVWGAFAARRSPALGAALAGVVTAQVFTSLVLPTAVFFFLILAMLVEPGTTRRIPALRVAAYACAAVLAFYAVRFAAADWALSDASRALDRGDLERSLSEYNRAADWRPSGSSADLYYSRRLANYVGKISDLRPKALALHAAYGIALNATHTSEERSNAWYNLAGFLSTTNAPADVERSLRESINAAPNWYKPHWVLAQLYLAERRLDDARAEAETAVRCNVKDPELLYTLENIRAAQRHLR